MTENNIISMLQMMGVNRIRPNASHSHVIATCPMAPWTHDKGTDKKPSFSVKVDNTGKSVGHCFACSASGTLMQLAKEYASHCYGENVIDFLKKNENYDDDWAPKNGSFGRRLNWDRAKWLFGDTEKERKKTVVPAVIEFDEDKVIALEWKVIEKYMNSVPQYVLNRGITIETAKAWRLGYNKIFQRVMMPEIDRRNRLVGYAQRSIGEPTGDYPKYLFNTGFMKMNFLYGENLITLERGDIVLVEGQFDALKVYQAGCNVLAIRGSEISDVQARKTIELLPPDKRIIVMMDGDKAGRKVTDSIMDKLKDKAPLINRKLKDKEDPGDLNTRQIKDLIMTNEYK